MYASFDIEVAESFDDTRENNGSLIHPPYRLPISCAAIAVHTDSEETQVFSFGIDDRMSPPQVRELVGTLSILSSMGCQIVTWNGAGFDFRCLEFWAKQGVSQFAARLWSEEVSFLARNHIDPGFLMVCQFGYMIGLNTCARALDVEGKLEGVSGVLAPLLWSGLTGKEDGDTLKEIASLGTIPGSLQARNLCLDYVKQDAITTLEVYLALKNLHRYAGIHWITARGKVSHSAWIPERDVNGDLLSVLEANNLPQPDISWMKDPRERSEYISWAEANVANHL